MPASRKVLEAALPNDPVHVPAHAGRTPCRAGPSIAWPVTCNVWFGGRRCLRPPGFRDAISCTGRPCEPAPDQPTRDDESEAAQEERDGDERRADEGQHDPAENWDGRQTNEEQLKQADFFVRRKDRSTQDRTSPEHTEGR